PYARKLSEMLSTVAAGAELAGESPYNQTRTVERVLLIVVTSDRGLAGAFNTNVVKEALVLINSRYAEQYRRGNVEILAIGKKGAEAFLRRGFKVNTNHIDTFLSLSFAKVRTIAEELMRDFTDGRYDQVEVVFN